jgi:tetratricopeptide (TPR) repeat protein
MPESLITWFRAMFRARRPAGSATGLVADNQLHPTIQVTGDLVTGPSTTFILPTERVPPAELPAEPNPFTGRQSLLTSLDSLIDTSVEPVAVRRNPMIHGMPGVGKTAVAIHWSYVLLAREYFPDGHLFLDLRGYSKKTAMSTDEALGRLLRGLGVHEKSIPRAEEEKEALYRTWLAGRRLLIMLDDAGGDAEQIRHLLPGTGSRCLVIITSRDRLTDLVPDGLHPIEVKPFEPGEALEYINAMVGEDRVDAEPGAAQTIARQCAFLPLALRVAMAKLVGSPHEPLENAAAELAEDRLPYLTPPHDPTKAVRSAFDLTYHALSPESQRAFRLLCLVDGSNFAVDAAAALLDAPEYVARQLIQTLERVHLVDQVGGNRYGVHDLLREYGREVGNTEPADARWIAVGKLLEFYLDRARTAGRSLGRHRRTIAYDDPAHERGGVPQNVRDTALDWLEGERANLVAAVRQAFGRGYTQLTWELADALYDFLAFRRYGQDNEVVHVQGLAAARHAEDSRAELFMLCHLGQIHLRGGAYDEARQYARQAYLLSRQRGDEKGEAESLTILARIRHAQGHVSESLELAATSRRIWRRVGDDHGEADALLTVGYIRWLDGQYDAALVSATWALDIQHRVGDRHGEADSLDLMAGAFRRIGHYNAAADYAERALSIRQDSGDRYGESVTLLNLARVRRRERDFDQALDLAGAARTIRQEMGDERGAGEALAVIARIHCHAGDLESARSAAERALALAGETSDRLTKADAGDTLARVHLARSERAQALELARGNRHIDSTVSDPYGRARRLDTLGRILLDLDRPEEALDHFNEARRIERRIGDALGAVQTLRVIAEAHRRLGNDAEAERASREAEALREETWEMWNRYNCDG